MGLNAPLIRWCRWLLARPLPVRVRRRSSGLSAPSGLVEILESRQMLSAVMVTTTSDMSNNGDTSSIEALLADPGSDGQISLREAILAANGSGGANTITFDPRLTARGRVTILPVQVGDVTADNSAFAISCTLEIVGAVDRNLVTLQGTGPRGDVRLFRVLAGGNLTLRGLTMTNWSTDTNGAFWRSIRVALHP